MPPPADLPLPAALIQLIESGFWPMNEDAARAQNLNSLISRDKIKSFSPEENHMYFFQPPFHTISWLKEHGEKEFWDAPMMVTHEINTDLTLVIGDFGLGSDAPIALDYRRDTANPSVICFRYSPKGSHWVEIAPTFDDFSSIILE